MFFHIVFGYDLICPDDEVAKTRATELAKAHDVELWQLGRHIATFKHK